MVEMGFGSLKKRHSHFLLGVKNTNVPDMGPEAAFCADFSVVQL